MEEILKTTLLEYEKSAFIVDLVEHNTGKHYIRLFQTILDEESDNKRSIKINPSLLSDIITVLNSYGELISYIENNQQKDNIDNSITLLPKKLSDHQKIAIQSRYLKGVSISDLTIQFDCNKILIEQILNNNGIAIVDQKMPQKKNNKRFRRNK